MSGRRVAITGFGVVSPVGTGREAFWRGLSEGKSGIGPIRRFDAGTFAAQLAAEVHDEIPLPEEVASVSISDTKVGFAFTAFREALSSAGIDRLDRRTLVHLGTSLEIFHLENALVDGQADFRAVAKRSLSGEGYPLQIPLDTAINLIARFFGEPGMKLTNCSACVAGAQAIGHGFHSIRSGRWDVAVCGGFDSLVNPLAIGGFQLLGALTTDNSRGPTACRPFDASRSGTVLGEGAAVLVLEPMEKALADDKTILAEIRGYGSTMDAHSPSAPDPDGEGAARAMEESLKDAGIPPEAVAYLNAHGTGTRLNDEVEATAIRRVFAGCWERLPVSSTKAMTGHLIAAAGAVEIGACLLTLVRGIMPPNPFLTKVGRGCELCHIGGPGRFEGDNVLTNSFGFGGQNASLVLGRAHA